MSLLQVAVGVVKNPAGQILISLRNSDLHQGGLWEFPGGEKALFKYLQDNIKYPEVMREEGISGNVILTFEVDKEGKIKDIKVLKEVKGGGLLTKEAIRVVERMPSWKPGKQNGRPVRVQYNLPIRFIL